MPLDRVFGQPFDVLVGHAVGRRGRSCFRRLGLLRFVALFVATVVLGTVDTAKAASILLGSDYLTTPRCRAPSSTSPESVSSRWRAGPSRALCYLRPMLSLGPGRGV